MSMDIFRFDLSKSHLFEEFKTLGWRHIFIHFCTAIGAWGGFPEPPLWWEKFVNSHELVKWFLLSILIFQGGDEQELQMALEFTLLFYLLYHASNHIYKFFIPCNKKSKEKSTRSTKSKPRLQTRHTTLKKNKGNKKK